MMLMSAMAAGRGAKKWRNPLVRPRSGRDLRVFLKRQWHVLTIAAVLAVSANAAVSLTGVVGDDMCAGDHKRMGGTDAMKCTDDCVKTMGAKYALIVSGKDGNDVYLLSDQTAGAKYIGKNVTVTGDLMQRTNGTVLTKTITVKSIAPAK
jgi:hypothetical protein